MIRRLWGRVDQRWAVRWIGLPVIAAVLLASRVDPWSPPVFGRERLAAVLLLDGQAYFGRVGESPLADTLEIRDVYYFQDARGTSTNLPLGLVRRGTEVHQPADGLFVRRDKVLAVETIGPASAVATAIATDRSLRELVTR